MSLERFATAQPTVCAVCRRHAVWLGFRPPGHHLPIIWLCDDEYCHDAAARVYAMPRKILDAYEIGALLEAGEIAGKYLEKLGTTDLAKLSHNEWREFLRQLLINYEHIFRRKILSDEPALTEASHGAV